MNFQTPIKEAALGLSMHLSREGRNMNEAVITYARGIYPPSGETIHWHWYFHDKNLL